MTGDDPIVLRIDKLRPCPDENASEIVMIPMTDSVDVDYSTTFCTDNEWDSQSFSTSSLSDRSSDCELLRIRQKTHKIVLYPKINV